MPFAIAGGVLAVASHWLDGVGEGIAKTLKELAAEERLDLGCAVDAGAFETSILKAKVRVEVAPRESALIFFLVRLLGRLQGMGTAPAMDLRKYGAKLSSRMVDVGPGKAEVRRQK
jgi:hypothetical protein